MIEIRRIVASISSLEAKRPSLPLKKEEDISIMSGSLSKGEIEKGKWLIWKARFKIGL